VRVPLMVFEPGRSERLDVRTPTSAVDLLPTLLQITGGRPADRAEGEVLPPFASTRETERSLYAVEAKPNAQMAPLTHATLMLVKGRYKLMYFTGYPELGADNERIELYDLEADPEELQDLSRSEARITQDLLAQLKSKLAEMNAPFETAASYTGG